MLLSLNGLEVDCIIGELPDERTRAQRLTVDVELTVGDAAADSDELADTVDYAALAEKVRAALTAAKCRMIERAAKIVCDVCREDPKVRAVRARVTKAGAVAHLGSASAEYCSGTPYALPEK